MLPSAKASLQRGGFSPKSAAWTLIGCFLGGVIGIQIASRVLHRFMPSHVVDCDHSHGADDPDKAAVDNDVQGRSPTATPEVEQNWGAMGPHSHSPHTIANHNVNEPMSGSQVTMLARRPSFQAQLSQRVSALVSSQKRFCDESGRCYGFSDPCGQDCFQIVQARGGSRGPHGHLPRGQVSRSITTPYSAGVPGIERQPYLQNVDEESPLLSAINGPLVVSHSHIEPLNDPQDSRHMNGYSKMHTRPHDHSHPHPPSPHHSLRKPSSTSSLRSTQSHHSDDSHVQSHRNHHHHVPTNAFLSIGLQTSLAIALHKLPEGFITYATNHANPRLGFSVFLALFVHNITEGFAMALPLYLAFGSRWRAMFWSSLLGGVSQPLGAGVAALWFHLSGKGGAGSGEPGSPGEGEGVYGCMFAATAGIMASVALQLFSESLDLTHNRNLCMAFAFVGMGILGMSSALTA